MAKRKRKTSGRSTASRRKNRTQDRMPAGLITLFAGLVLMALAFVPGSSAWRTMHDVLFGVFGCGSFVLGAALCYLAILYTRGQDLLMQVFKLLLGLIFASGTVIVFSDIPADLTAAQMIAACYQNGANAWLGGGVLGELGWLYQSWAGARSYSPGLIDVARRQHTQLLRAMVSLPLSKEHGLFLEYRMVRNRENISLFAYQSRSVQLGWQWQFGR